MKTITKEFNLLDIEDIEEAVSEYLGEKISISDIECTLTYCKPWGYDMPDGMYLDFRVEENWFDSYDVFSDEETDGFCWKGEDLALNEPYLPAENIFNFDVSAFKSFDSSVDSSD